MTGMYSNQNKRNTHAIRDQTEKNKKKRISSLASVQQSFLFRSVKTGTRENVQSKKKISLSLPEKKRSREMLNGISFRSFSLLFPKRTFREDFFRKFLYTDPKTLLLLFRRICGILSKLIWMDCGIDSPDDQNRSYKPLFVNYFWKVVVVVVLTSFTCRHCRKPKCYRFVPPI